MREIPVEEVQDKIEKLFVMANFELPEEVVHIIIKAAHLETSPTAKEIFRQILKNAEIARDEKLPLCQDCGVALIFMEIGQDIVFTGGDLSSAVNEGVRRAYKNNYLRFSIVEDPFSRVNTKNNTPAFIHYEIVPGNELRIIIMPKGGGCENMSQLRMFSPSAGINGVKKFILESVKQSGANPCPPLFLGIGIGGTFEYAPYLAKKALLRKIGTPNPDPSLDSLERELLEGINTLGIGPQGMGGSITALAVHILKAPCHIASLPVALSFQCHSHRYKEVII
ncbi:MAG: fumarate hydratase [Spirochaetales bacterium]|nr:fumarate hydratase [Spirochaetales bacterium]